MEHLRPIGRGTKTEKFGTTGSKVHPSNKRYINVNDSVQPAPPPATALPAKAAAAKESEKKFGRAVMSHGAYILPAILLRSQARLNVNSTEMIVLLQLLDFWWAENSSSFPSMSKIAERISLSTKQVQRTINSLVDKGLIASTNRTLPNNGKTSNLYTFDGLIEKLAAFEKDFAAARRIKEAASKPGGIIANKE